MDGNCECCGKSSRDATFRQWVYTHPRTGREARITLCVDCHWNAMRGDLHTWEKLEALSRSGVTPDAVSAP